MEQREVWIVTLKLACPADEEWEGDYIEWEIAKAVEDDHIKVITVDAQCAKVEPNTDN